MPWVNAISKLSRKRRGRSCWAYSLLFFGAGLGASFLLGPLTGLKFLTFYPAIAAAALICGWIHGILVLVASTLAAWYFFHEPQFAFAPADPRTLAGLLGFLLVGGFIVLLLAALRETVARLERANQMQEALFRELQHRVANNLQIVVSMLRNAQRNLGQPEATAQMLTEAEERIWAMSQLHRRLHDGTAFASGVEPLLNDMLAETFRDMPVRVTLKLEETLDLSIDQVTAMILLVNEAALNSAKHVFARGLGRRFDVSLTREADGRLQLLIRDDGPGMKEEMKSDDAPSLGLNLMRAFATQLGGTLALSSSDGMALRVDFTPS